MKIEFTKEDGLVFPTYDGWRCLRCDQIVMRKTLLKAKRAPSHPSKPKSGAPSPQLRNGGEDWGPRSPGSPGTRQPVEIMSMHSVHCPFRGQEDMDVFRADFYSRKRPAGEFVPKRKPPKAERGPQRRITSR